MGRKQYNNQYLKTMKDTRDSKGGYKLNRNGVPLDDNNNNVMNTHKFQYKTYKRVGRYRPTPYNISDI